MRLMTTDVWFRSRRDLNFPSVFRNHQGTLFLAFTIGTHGQDERWVAVMSEDEGSTWLPDTNPILYGSALPWMTRPYPLAGHPKMRVVGPLRDGSWLGYSNTEGEWSPQLRTYRSYDDGQAWTEEFWALGGLGLDRRLFPFGSLVEEEDGTLLVPLYGYQGPYFTPGSYETWVGAVRPGEMWVHPRGRVAHGAGQGWAEGPCEPALVRYPDGRMICVMRTSGQHDPLIQCDSRDGGQTWSDPAILDTEGVAPLAVQLPDRGPTMLVYGRRTGDHDGVVLRLSTDEGQHWSDSVWVYEGVGCNYANALVDGADRVTVLYAASHFTYTPAGRPQFRPEGWNEVRATQVTL
ncbi:MAG: exo-alpha-sialidase [Candidatus Latescibacteria bacterium]|nr:exo-alpha-sialidase [Candidatus Latescibacterota bacterium]